MFPGQMRGPYRVRVIKVRLNWGIDTEESREIILSVQKLQVNAYFTNKSQYYQFTCHTPTEEIQEITDPKNKVLKAKYQRPIAAFGTTINRLTISVPVFILPVFWQFFLRNGNILSKSLFWKERTQCVESRWQQKSFHKHFNEL